MITRRKIIFFGVGLISLSALFMVYRAVESQNDFGEAPTDVERIAEPWTGDFDETLAERRFIRALVS